MPNDLTESQRAAYLADPTKCPCCGESMVLLVDSEYGNAIEYRRLMMCGECSAQWTDDYTLTDITLTRKPNDPEDEK